MTSNLKYMTQRFQASSSSPRPPPRPNFFYFTRACRCMALKVALPGMPTVVQHAASCAIASFYVTPRRVRFCFHQHPGANLWFYIITFLIVRPGKNITGWSFRSKQYLQAITLIAWRTQTRIVSRTHHSPSHQFFLSMYWFNKMCLSSFQNVLHSPIKVVKNRKQSLDPQALVEKPKLQNETFIKSKSKVQ